jgi:hypothetical protein
MLKVLIDVSKVDDNHAIIFLEPEMLCERIEQSEDFGVILIGCEDGNLEIKWEWIVSIEGV